MVGFTWHKKVLLLFTHLLAHKPLQHELLSVSVSGSSAASREFSKLHISLSTTFTSGHILVEIWKSFFCFVWNDGVEEYFFPRWTVLLSSCVGNFLAETSSTTCFFIYCNFWADVAAVDIKRLVECCAVWCLEILIQECELPLLELGWLKIVHIRCTVADSGLQWF